MLTRDQAAIKVRTARGAARSATLHEVATSRAQSAALARSMQSRLKSALHKPRKIGGGTKVMF